VNARKTLRKGLLTLTYFAALCSLLLFAGGLFDGVLPAGLPSAASLSRTVSANPPPPPPGDLTVSVIGEAAKIYRIDTDPDVFMGVRVPGGTDDFPVSIHCDPAATVSLCAYDYEGWTFMRWEWTIDEQLYTVEHGDPVHVFVTGPNSRAAVYMRADVDIHDGHNGSMVPETEEETRGAFTVPNTNDTDGDSIIDWDDLDVPGEEDLIKVVFNKPEPAAKADELAAEDEYGVRGEMRIYAAGGPDIRLWKSSDKSGGQETRTRIPIGDFPLTLWLEGGSASTALRDTTVSCTYELERHDPSTTDIAKVTFITMDLAANDLDGAVAEGDEYAPGAFIHYNIDNDNGNTSGGDPVADYTEDGPVAGENDLELASAAAFPAWLTTGTVALKRSGGGIKVWKAGAKGTANALLTTISEVTWDLSDPTERSDFNTVRTGFYVEGCSDSTATLSLEYSQSGIGFADKVKYTGIAATCGEQPDPTQRSTFETAFPAIKHCEWSITGDATAVYNCIAWSVGDTTKWYNKITSDRARGIVGIDEEFGNDDGVFSVTDDMDPFYLAKTGYTPTASGAADAEVMYYSGFHAAKNLGCSCGFPKWLMYESKCGALERIEHVYSQLNGSSYGTPTRYYK
jgi:hypothetical protein